MVVEDGQFAWLLRAALENRPSRLYIDTVKTERWEDAKRLYDSGLSTRQVCEKLGVRSRETVRTYRNNAVKYETMHKEDGIDVLSVRISISRSSISNWSTGKSLPQRRTLDKITKKLEEEFGIPVEDWYEAWEYDKSSKIKYIDVGNQKEKTGKTGCRVHGLTDYGSNCRICYRDKIAVRKEKAKEEICRACGKKGTSINDPTFTLCPPCYNSYITYGDVTVNKTPRAGQGQAGYRGVTKSKAPRRKNKLWVAKLYHNKKQIWLGYYSTPEEAAKAWDAKAKELGYPENKLNFP